MHDDETTRLLNIIGCALLDDPDYPYENTLLYAEVDVGYAEENIFKELPDRILFRLPRSMPLLHGLIDLWKSQTGERRWTEIEYLLRSGTVDVRFHYPDEMDPEEDVRDRAKRAVRRRFGVRPIEFPPMPDDDEETYDL